MTKKSKSIIHSVGLSSVLAGVIAFGGIAAAFGETVPTGVEIKEFSLLDTARDVVGAADFTPEGNKDGHFKLLLNLANKTTIKSVVLRSTDDYGKDNYQGVWRTNRVTTGWLLGIVQDKTVVTPSGTTHISEIINPGFRKDVKEPVGEFAGNLTFDLYASNNGTIKETQSYVLEIETPEGTVVSKPIKYNKPMTSGGTSSTPSPTSTPSPSPTPVPTTPTPSPTPIPSPNPSSPPVPAPAQGPTIHVWLLGQELQFEDAKPIIKDGSTLVPFRKLFEALGFSVTWIDNGTTQRAIGTKDGLTIELTMNSATAKVNGKDVSLSIPAQIIDNHTMVPLRFVAENSGYQVTYASDGTTATIRIDEPEDTSSTPEPTPVPVPAPIPDFPKETAEPYVAKGYVRDMQGHPLSDIVVYADNTLLYDSNIIGVTDENGHYEIELPQLATSWSMSADITKSFNGKKYKFHLEPENEVPLTGSKGGVRNFTWTDFNGQIYIYPFFTSSNDSMPEFDLSDLEVTLTPVGPLLDGSTGQTIIKRGGPVIGGGGIDGIPIGKYKATARWMPEGYAPIPLQISDGGVYSNSVEFEFREPNGVNTSKYLSELEVKIP
ncbi:copper amine oxidase N-terminal domain-containing protein [Paenibacillus roseipurpureus]|uniref:Stalk domain-containing protein n=1 Tax=Paenibacillus roseopurpureus TaxID=2918901 RepID=A0AA96LS29_9BACL|nr:stalk domain-containing protein [Paenibacillus sp. MBLB1832]WNR46182.1 stalk domain-containing protein [Paenibacillus sp. MBLB1832]